MLEELILNVALGYAPGRRVVRDAQNEQNTGISASPELTHASLLATWKRARLLLRRTRMAPNLQPSGRCPKTGRPPSRFNVALGKAAVDESC